MNLNASTLLPILLVIGGLMDLGIALILHYSFVRLRKKPEEVRRHWRQVPARILSSRVVQERGQSLMMYRALIQYEYSIDGVRYGGDRYSLVPKWSSSNRGPHDKMAAEYPTGLETMAWVNPRNPAEAVLKNDATPPSATTLIVFFLVLMGLGMMAAGPILWFSKRAS